MARDCFVKKNLVYIRLDLSCDAVNAHGLFTFINQL